MAALPAGKLRNLMTLADANGRLKMMAIDQRMSLERSLETMLGRPGRYEEMVQIKRAVTRALAPHATAVLLDVEFGYPHCLPALPGNVGLLLAYERPGFEPSGPAGRERRSALIEGWGIGNETRRGRNAIQLPLDY